MSQQKCKGSKFSIKFRIYFEKLHSFVILFILVPTVYTFALFFAIPQLAEEFEAGKAKICMHVFICTFFLVNVSGNMIMSILTDNSFTDSDLNIEDWTICELCNMKRPARSWHCNICNKCILKRDHHCRFFSTCIGHYNQRYYLLFLAHLFLSMTYALYYNCYYFTPDSDLVSIFYTLTRVTNPMMSFLFQEEWQFQDFSLIILVLNVVVIIWSFSLLFYHTRNMLRGGTYTECEKTGILYDMGWKQNSVEAFGQRWYLTILSPFISSPLPSDGINWDRNKK